MMIQESYVTSRSIANRFGKLKQNKYIPCNIWDILIVCSVRIRSTKHPVFYLATPTFQPALP